MSEETSMSGLNIRPNDAIRNILIKKIITNVNVDDFMKAFNIINNNKINKPTKDTIKNVKDKIEQIDYYTLFELYEKVNTEKKYKSPNMKEIIVHINKIVNNDTSKEKINELEYDKIVSLHEKVNTEKNKEIYKNTNMNGIIDHIHKIFNDLNKYTVVPFHELESGKLYKSYEKENGKINDIGKYTGESSTNSNNITDKFAYKDYIFESVDNEGNPVRKKHTELEICPNTHFILKNKDDSLSANDIKVNGVGNPPSGGRKRRKTKKKTHSMRKKTKQKSKKPTRRKTKRRLSKK